MHVIRCHFEFQCVHSLFSFVCLIRILTLELVVRSTTLIPFSSFFLTPLWTGLIRTFRSSCLLSFSFFHVCKMRITIPYHTMPWWYAIRTPNSVRSEYYCSVFTLCKISTVSHGHGHILSIELTKACVLFMHNINRCALCILHSMILPYSGSLFASHTYTHTPWNPLEFFHLLWTIISNIILSCSNCRVYHKRTNVYNVVDAGYIVQHVQCS